MDAKKEKTMAADYNYTGPSMNPTLKVGDGLTVIPYEDENIRIGDVVVFRSSESDRYIVHRVISVDSRGIRTKGDNNNKVDSWILHPEDIVGRVTSAQRGNKSIIIHGGTHGRLLAPMLWTIKRVKIVINRILSPVYQILIRMNFLKGILSRLISTQILYFKRPNGIEMQLIMGRWVIGRYSPVGSRWIIRRPFRLFVDEKSLPQAENHLSQQTIEP